MVKSTVWESPYYNFTLYCCKKSIGFISPESPCWVSYGKLEAIESRFGWIMWVLRKSRKQQPNLMQISEIRWKIDCISSFLFFGTEVGQLVAGDWGCFPHCFTEIHINFWLKFQSLLLWPFQWRTTQSLQQRQWLHFGACLICEKLLLLSSFEKQKFDVFFFVFALKLYCFILSSKPWILLKWIFLLKRNFLFVCLFCQTLFPEPPVPSSWLFWELGSGRASTTLGTVCLGFCPVPATLVPCWCWQWDWAAAGWSQAAPALPFLRARVLTRVPALVSSLGNHVLLHELPPAVSGIWTILTSQLQDCSVLGGLHFRAGWSSSPKHTLLLPRIMQKNPPILLTPAGSGFRVLFPGFAKLYLN